MTVCVEEQMGQTNGTVTHTGGAHANHVCVEERLGPGNGNVTQTGWGGA